MTLNLASLIPHMGLEMKSHLVSSVFVGFLTLHWKPIKEVLPERGMLETASANCHLEQLIILQG